MYRGFYTPPFSTLMELQVVPVLHLSIPYEYAINIRIHQYSIHPLDFPMVTVGVLCALWTEILFPSRLHAHISFQRFIQHSVLQLTIFFLWRCGPTLVVVSSFSRFLDQTHRRTTFGRSPLDEGSTRRRDLYLTTYNNHNRHTSMTSAGFETEISAFQRP